MRTNKTTYMAEDQINIVMKKNASELRCLSAIDMLSTATTKS